MRIPIRLCGEEAEADQEHLEKNGDWEQPGNDQVEHPYPCTYHVVSPLRAKNGSLLFEGSNAKSRSRLLQPQRRGGSVGNLREWVPIMVLLSLSWMVQEDATTAKHGMAASSPERLPLTARATGPGPLPGARWC